MTEIKTLLADLEAADVGTRELSDRVLVALGWVPHRNSAGGIKALRTPNGSDDDWYWHTRPNPTMSVDDALALIPRKDYWIQITMTKDICDVEVGAYEQPEGFPKDAGIGGHPAKHKELPMALTIAGLWATHHD